MGKSKDKKALREAKADKNLLLRVKKKQLKKKKSGGLDDAVESEEVQNVILEDKEMARRKKNVLAKQKKKKKQLKEGTSFIKTRDVEEFRPENKDEGMAKLKNKKKKLKEGNSSVEPNNVEEIPLENKDKGTPKLKKKEKNKKLKEANNSVEPNDEEETVSENQEEGILNADVAQLEMSEAVGIGEPEEPKRGKKRKTKKAKKAEKSDKKDMHASSKENKLERNIEVDTANVAEIPSVDEDCSRGMKKWILEYKQSRPGLKVLQQRIDEFITAYEEQQEQERKEREARAAGEGWTVVVHHKGRKRTTDAESGTTVGSIGQAALQEKMAKKKSKEVDLNFYRFQKREAQRNEIMMLQSRFEQDKKRIQQLRAQRKFKPY